MTQSDYHQLEYPSDVPNFSFCPTPRSPDNIPPFEGHSGDNTIGLLINPKCYPNKSESKRKMGKSSSAGHIGVFYSQPKTRSWRLEEVNQGIAKKQELSPLPCQQPLTERRSHTEVRTNTLRKLKKSLTNRLGIGDSGINNPNSIKNSSKENVENTEQNCRSIIHSKSTTGIGITKYFGEQNKRITIPKIFRQKTPHSQRALQSIPALNFDPLQFASTKKMGVNRPKLHSFDNTNFYRGLNNQRKLRLEEINRIKINSIQRTERLKSEGNSQEILGKIVNMDKIQKINTAWGRQCGEIVKVEDLPNTPSFSRNTKAVKTANPGARLISDDAEIIMSEKKVGACGSRGHSFSMNQNELKQALQELNRGSAVSNNHILHKYQERSSILRQDSPPVFGKMKHPQTLKIRQKLNKDSTEPEDIDNIDNLKIKIAKISLNNQGSYAPKRTKSNSNFPKIKGGGIYSKLILESRRINSIQANISKIRKLGANNIELSYINQNGNNKSDIVPNLYKKINIQANCYLNTSKGYSGIQKKSAYEDYHSENKINKFHLKPLGERDIA